MARINDRLLVQPIDEADSLDAVVCDESTGEEVKIRGEDIGPTIEALQYIKRQGELTKP